MQQNINALSYSMCSPCPRNLLEMTKIIMYDTQLYLAYTEQGILYVDAHQLLKCFKPNLKTSYDIKISTQFKRLTFVEIYENYNLPNRIIKTCIHLLSCNDNKFTTIQGLTFPSKSDWEHNWEVLVYSQQLFIVAGNSPVFLIFWQIWTKFDHIWLKFDRIFVLFKVKLQWRECQTSSVQVEQI
ncbi:Hypothetical_protein [Hexamita inflata]|uniref:Hypothetical_protein n=1 Tax=Hexamita inflata TaxID=28002 RepID=A0AA86QZN0_9EUKA|nr:Hypothetical protein HINF_LOCUS56646 [Hexamita inflata]